MPAGKYTLSRIHKAVKAAHKLPPALSPTNIIFFGVILK